VRPWKKTSRPQASAIDWRMTSITCDVKVFSMPFFSPHRQTLLSAGNHNDFQQQEPVFTLFTTPRRHRFGSALFD
jgi:hypothetical protein